MARHNRFSIASLIVLLLLSATLVFTLSCDQESSILYDEIVGDLSGTGAIDPETPGDFLLGSVSNAELTPGRIEIWAKDLAFDEETGIVSFDVELVNRSLVVIPAPIRFVITSVAPADIAVVRPDGSSPDGFPFYDFSDALGDDDLFSPEERTAPVAMKFHTVTARSFAIGYRIDVGPAEGEGTIYGIVYLDADRDGEFDRCDGVQEPGIPGITVAIEQPLSTGTVMLLSRTDSLGRYRFGGLAAGVYKVMVAAREDVWEVTTANPLLVTLVERDGVVQNYVSAHFGLFPILAPVPEVLFGPVLVGPATVTSFELNATFVSPPSLLTVVYSYYLDVAPPPFEWPLPAVVDTAAAWINGELAFEYRRAPYDSAGFAPRTVRLRDGLVKVGENAIRLFTDGDENAALLWRVYRQP